MLSCEAYFLPIGIYLRPCKAASSGLASLLKIPNRIAVVNIPTITATTPFQHIAPITKYEIKPPSGAIASMPKINDTTPPIAAPGIQAPKVVNGCEAT